MFNTGLVSISFRSLTPEQIVDYMLEAGLRYVEWGSDVHAKKDDHETLQRIAALQQEKGIQICGNVFIGTGIGSLQPNLRICLQKKNFQEKP